MTYRVIKWFYDLQDENHVYRVGDVFPREGFEPAEGRYAELASKKNRRGVPLIKKEVQRKKKAETDDVPD